MSRGPGRIMRSITDAIEAEPKRHFTFAELAAIAYGGEPITRSRLVVVRRVVQEFEAAKRVSLGALREKRPYPERPRWFCTVRAFDPKAGSAASDRKRCFRASAIAGIRP
jgi:hypothetical protein